MGKDMVKSFEQRYGVEPFTKDEAGLYERSLLRKGYFDGYKDATFKEKNKSH